MDFNGIKFVVVGAGFYGSVTAERIANNLGEKVVVLEKRDHIGGNSWSFFDQKTNIEIHKYGSHIFHTSNREVWDYINRFGKFNEYRHQVITIHNGKPYTMPINLLTINNFYGKNLKPWEVEAFLQGESAKEKVKNPSNLEEAIVGQIGYPLYKAFVRGYTMKQWQTDPVRLPAGIIQRLPVRYNYNTSYFSDLWEGIPEKGYGDIFRNMLDFENIEVRLGVDFFQVKDQIPDETCIIYTGPVDRFFNYKYGELCWRTLDFKEEVLDYSDYQGTAVVNYADEENPYIRTHEFRHYHPEIDYSGCDKTIVFHETSRFAKKDDLPYYPVGRDEDKKKLEKYQADAEKLNNVIFGGRLGEYRYYDMHHVIGLALKRWNYGTG